MYDWNSIKKTRRIAYLFLINNTGLGLLLFDKKSKSSPHNKQTDGKVGHIYAKRGVKLRNEPNANSNSISSIGNGEPVIILNDTSTTFKGWVEVSYNGSTGWIWGDYLK
jgi:uncharacterized protein YgiM (DUF1202 family)